jgi:uncharacterized protein (DUF362 family)/ferredoxin
MPATVSVLRHASYDGVEAAVRRLLEPLGGIGAFVKPGQTVLLKPNLLTEVAPEKAVTTHPDVVRALIRLVKAVGAAPVVADSPANVAELDRIWTTCGVRALCAEEGVPLLNLEQAGSRRVERLGVVFNLAEPVAAADVVINVPKVKTHSFTLLTAGVKNLYGCVPGFQKTALHKRHPRPQDFARVIAAVYATVRPALTVADGILALEGDGPSSGGRPRALGVLAASADAVALDVHLCRLIGLHWENVPYLPVLRENGIGETDTTRIRVEGPALDAPLLPDYRRPGTHISAGIPLWLIRPLQPLVWTRPRFTERCIQCGRCIRQCPAEALTEGSDKRPVLAPERCIACCCCHEICPADAIVMQSSPLLRVAAALRRLVR